MLAKGKQITVLLSVTLLILGGLAGCMNQEAGGLPSGETQVLRVMGGWGDEQYVRTNWTDYYELTHNVEVEIIPMYEPIPHQEGVEPETPIERMRRVLTGETPPDVIILDDLSMLSTLVEEGLVQPLDTFMEKSNFDVNNLVPGVREGIRAAGDGNSLYALAQTFQSQALFYNKDLFTAKGLPFPTDHMTWDEIADLAIQLNSGEGADRIYGFWSNEGNGFYHFVNVFANPLGLNIFTDDYQGVAFNTPAWERAITKYIQFVHDGVFPKEPDYSQEWTPEMDLFWRAFYNGKAAMALMYSYELQHIQNTARFDPEMMNFDWDVVTVPTHAEAPGIGGQLYMQGIMAINRNAEQAELAWDFIHFLNGEEVLKLKSRQMGMFVTQEPYIQNNMEHGPANIQAFYQLKPAPNLMNEAYQQGGDKIYEVIAIADQVFQEMVRGDKDIKEGLAELQRRGQEIMEQQR